MHLNLVFSFLTLNKFFQVIFIKKVSAAQVFSFELYGMFQNSYSSTTCEYLLLLKSEWTPGVNWWRLVPLTPGVN